MVARRGRDTLKDDVRALVDVSIAAHLVSPKLHAILTAEAARMQLPRFESEADAGIAAEHALWMAAAAHKPALPELSMWMAVTAAHAVIHTACLERPDDVKRPEFAEELTRLITRFFSRA